MINMMQLDMLGGKFRFVPGYRGSGKLRAAVLQGKISIGNDAAHAYLNVVTPMLINKGIAMPLWQKPLPWTATASW